jgi:hypothetical protein
MNKINFPVLEIQWIKLKNKNNSSVYIMVPETKTLTTKERDLRSDY